MWKGPSTRPSQPAVFTLTATVLCHASNCTINRLARVRLQHGLLQEQEGVEGGRLTAVSTHGCRRPASGPKAFDGCSSPVFTSLSEKSLYVQPEFFILELKGVSFGCVFVVENSWSMA